MSNQHVTVYISSQASYINDMWMIGSQFILNFIYTKLTMSIFVNICQHVLIHILLKFYVKDYY